MLYRSGEPKLNGSTFIEVGQPGYSGASFFSARAPSVNARGGVEELSSYHGFRLDQAAPVLSRTFGQ